MELILSTSEFRLFKDLIYRLCGINLAEGKRQMLQTRLSRRIRNLTYDSFQAYFDHLDSPTVTDSELVEFINCITTNKTDFFREPHHFEFVVDTILPELYRGTRELSVWHAGCSTGEEPYTLAIALSESLKGKPFRVRQLATDIDTNVLDQARSGLYELDKLAPISPALRSRYFLKGKGDKEGLAKVKPELAEWLTFGRVNLLDERWPFKAKTQFDVIFCRNVMIYFDKPTQRRLVERFERVLKPGGYLFIGHSESLFGINRGLECLGKTIYRRTSAEEVAE